MKKHPTPMFDQLEQGPWPSFVTGIKRLRDEHGDERITGVANSLLGQIERADFAVIGSWRDDLKVDQEEVKAYVERKGRKYVIDNIVSRCPTHALSLNDWIDRIGWPRFFELTELPFSKFHIDNWRGSRKSLNASTHLRF